MRRRLRLLLMMAVPLLAWLCPLEAMADEPLYVFDTMLRDGETLAEFSDADAAGNRVAILPANSGSFQNYCFSNTVNVTTEAETAICYVAKNDGSGAVPVDFYVEYDVVPTTRDEAYGDKGVYDLSAIKSVDIKITYNVNTNKVVFDPYHEEKPAPERLYLVDYKDRFGTSVNDGNDVFRFEYVIPANADNYPYYAFSDTEDPHIATILLGSEDVFFQSQDYSVEPQLGEEYRWHYITWDYLNACWNSFLLEQKPYDIVVDWKNHTVVFTDAAGEPPVEPDPVIEVPQTLYLVDYQSSFGSAENDGTGVFKFINVTPSNTSYPYYGFSNTETITDDMLMISARDAATATKENHIKPEEGVAYEWHFTTKQCIFDEMGSFELENRPYNIVFDWNAGTVTFTDPNYVDPNAPVPAPQTLYLVDYMAAFGSAVNDGNNVFRFTGVVPGNTNGYPNYGFSDTDQFSSDMMMISAQPAASATSDNNVVPEMGKEYPWYFSSWDNVNNCWGTFVLENKEYDIVLDWDKRTIVFTKTPAAPLEQMDKLYVTDTYLETIYGIAGNDGNGVYTADIEVVDNGKYIVFADRQVPKDDHATRFIGAETGDAGNLNFTVEYGVDYPITETDYNSVWADTYAFQANAGRYRVTVDLTSRIARFDDISRGDVWTVPTELGLFDYNMSKLGDGVATTDGVFTFENIVVTEKTNVVFTDDADNGKLFGANMTGADGTDVRSYRTYDLYMPKRNSVVVDGKSCFILMPGTWSITVDLNERTVRFIEASAPYMPEHLNMSISGADAVAGTESQMGVFVWKADIAAGDVLTFTDPASGRNYGSAESVTLTVSKPTAMTDNIEAGADVY